MFWKCLPQFPCLPTVDAILKFPDALTLTEVNIFMLQFIHFIGFQTGSSCDAAVQFCADNPILSFWYVNSQLNEASCWSPLISSLAHTKNSLQFVSKCSTS